MSYLGISELEYVMHQINKNQYPSYFREGLSFCRASEILFPKTSPAFDTLPNVYLVNMQRDWWI